MGINPVVLSSILRQDLSSVLNDSQFNCSSLWPDATLREAAAFSIWKSILKKLRAASSSERDSVALTKFLRVNDMCKNWSLKVETTWDEVLVGELKSSLHHFFNPGSLPLWDHPYDYLSKGRCGPGSAVGARGGSFYAKLFASPLTFTDSSLYFWYKRYIRAFPEWSNAELIRKEHYGDGHVVVGNRISFVAKDDSTSRTICVEPNLNMFAQLGLAHILEKRLASTYGINLSTQPLKNATLARLGSLNGDTSTIDLSSASDSMSWSLVKEFFPSYVCRTLSSLRSHFTTLPDGTKVPLEMVSTMGNGFTFPLQTIFFASIVTACARARNFKLRFPRGQDWGNFGVFGDDIACPVSLTRDVLRLLQLTGFTPNVDKTFVEGPFRESCGYDYFRGCNIRGVYVKDIDTPQDRYAVINQLNLFSTRTGILLPKTVQYLASTVKWCPVPRYENMSSGIHIPFSLLKDVWYCSDTQSVLYSRYEPIPCKIKISDRLSVPRGHKPLIFNPSGLLVSFLQGSISSSAISIRHDKVRWRVKRAVSPFWDALPPIHPLAGWFNWQRWNTAVYLNLYG